MISLAPFAALFLAFWAGLYACGPLLARSGRAGARWFARWLRGRSRLRSLPERLEAWRSLLPVVGALAIGTVLVVCAADAFIDIAAALKQHDPVVRAIDAAVHGWFGSRRTPGGNALFVVITTAGGPVAMGVLVAGVLAVLVARGRPRHALYLGITAVGGALLSLELKSHFLRQRPDMAAAVLGAMGTSFPSGHAMGATIVLGALAYLGFRLIPSWTWRSAALSALATFALAVGVSRLYLGVHWTSDVGAGFAAGLLWVTATTTGYELVRQVRHVREDRARRRLATGSS